MQDDAAKRIQKIRHQHVYQEKERALWTAPRQSEPAALQTGPTGRAKQAQKLEKTLQENFAK
jgi:hypothetical protein